MEKHLLTIFKNWSSSLTANNESSYTRSVTHCSWLFIKVVLKPSPFLFHNFTFKIQLHRSEHFCLFPNLWSGPKDTSGHPGDWHLSKNWASSCKKSPKKKDILLLVFFSYTAPPATHSAWCDRRTELTRGCQEVRRSHTNQTSGKQTCCFSIFFTSQMPKEASG